MALYYLMSAEVKGDIAEFGTHGVTAAVIAEFLFEHPRFQPKLHLFDSFMGFPKLTAEPDRVCPHVLSGAWAEGTSRGTRAATDVACIVGKWLEPSRFAIHGGWYEETLKEIPADAKFSLLLMDCCLYLSHYQVLHRLFANRMVADGAMIMFSDWNANRASWEYGSRRAWRDITSKFAVNYDYWDQYAWGGQKFIVHFSQPGEM